MLKQRYFFLSGKVAFLALCISLSSCGGAPQPDDTNAGTPDNTDPKSTVPEVVAIEKSQCTDPSLPFKWPELLRLTPAEYQNTVNQLLQINYPASELFPKDKLAGSFQHAPTVTDTFSEQYQSAAELIAKQAVADLDELTHCSLNNNTCAEQFIASFASKAFRRPLAQAVEAGLIKLFYDEKNANNLEAGVQAVIEAVLQSPFFLYRNSFTSVAGSNQEKGEAQRFANRLSYLLTGTGAEAWLIELAESGSLNASAPDSANARREAVNRLLQQPETKHYLAEHFFARWFEIDTISEHRDDLSVQTREAARAAAIEFISHHAWTDGLQSLFTAQEIIINEGMEVLGIDASVGRNVDLNRSGILTQPAWLIAHASSAETAPIIRGIFIREALLCEELPAPPAGEIAFPDPVQGVSMRERLVVHREDPGCAACHAFFDEMGLTLENYDHLGRYRTEEFPGAFIQTSGEVAGIDGNTVAFSDAHELMTVLADSKALRQCFARKWMKFAYRQEPSRHRVSCREKELAELLNGPDGLTNFINAVVAYTPYLTE